MEGYTVEKLLGQGTFGFTQLIFDSSTNNRYALKTIDLSPIDSKDYNFTLSQNTSKLAHPNVVSYEDSFVDRQGKKWLVLLRHCTGKAVVNVGGNLEELVAECRREERKVEEEVVWKVAGGVLAGLSYVNNHNMIHRNLKLENVLIDEQGNPRIADFGIAEFFHKLKKPRATFPDTFLYMSPEILGGEEHSSNTDVWSLGCILHQLCTLSVLFISSVAFI